MESYLKDWVPALGFIVALLLFPWRRKTPHASRAEAIWLSDPLILSRRRIGFGAFS